MTNVNGWDHRCEDTTNEPYYGYCLGTDPIIPDTGVNVNGSYPNSYGHCSRSRVAGNNGATNFGSPPFCQYIGAQANVMRSSPETSLPLATWVSLVFLAFFVGIILSYVVYKVRKSSATYQEKVPSLSDSQHKEEGLDSSNNVEKPLNLSPLSEQV